MWLIVSISCDGYVIAVVVNCKYAINRIAVNIENYFVTLHCRCGSRLRELHHYCISLTKALHLAFVEACGKAFLEFKSFSSRSEEHTSELQSRENLVC